MSRTLDYEADAELSELIDRLRLTLERVASPPAELFEEVESVMSELMARNRLRRVLLRMQLQGWMDGRPEQAREELEQRDAHLRERLPELLARLEPADRGGPQAG
jgi:hypothetical protein